MIHVVEVLEATVGGTRKHLRYLVDALPPGEFDVTVVCSTKRDPTFACDIDHFRRSGRRVHVVPMVRAPHPYRDWASIRRLRTILKSAPCDVLHLHSSKAGWVGRLAAWDLGCKVVYSPHAFPFQQQCTAPVRRLYRFAERLTARRTDMLLAVSPAEGRLAVDSGLFESSRVRVVSNALSLPELDGEVARFPGVDERNGSFRIGFLGDLRRQKDPLTFLDAASILSERRRDAQFFLPEWGPMLPAVRRRLRRRPLAGRAPLVPRAGRYA